MPYLWRVCKMNDKQDNQNVMAKCNKCKKEVDKVYSWAFLCWDCYKPELTERRKEHVD